MVWFFLLPESDRQCWTMALLMMHKKGIIREVFRFSVFYLLRLYAFFAIFSDLFPISLSRTYLEINLKQVSQFGSALKQIWSLLEFWTPHFAPNFANQNEILSVFSYILTSRDQLYGSRKIEKF